MVSTLVLGYVIVVVVAVALLQAAKRGDESMERDRRALARARKARAPLRVVSEDDPERETVVSGRAG